MEEEKQESAELEDKVKEVRLKIWYGILDELSKSKRFLKFVDSNFTIIEEKDEEKKTIDIRVVEKPEAVGPPLSSGQLVRLGKIVSTSGCKDVSGTVNKILTVLGQADEGAGLDLSTDVEKAIKQTKLD